MVVCLAEPPPVSPTSGRVEGEVKLSVSKESEGAKVKQDKGRKVSTVSTVSTKLLQKL